MLPPEDRALLEALEYQPDKEPTFDPLRCCLVWADERPVGLTPIGYEFLGDLWIVRGFMHRGVAEHAWGLDPVHFRSVWEYAQSTGLRWPGFRRINLADRDVAILKAGASDPDPF